MENFGVFVLGLVAGTVVTILGDLVKTYVQRPKIEILEDEPEDGDGWSCHAIRVTNNGRSTARNCTGLISFLGLASDQLLGDDKIKSLEDVGLDPRKFDVPGERTFLLKGGESFRAITNELTAWSRVGNPITIDLYPKTFAMLDICLFMKGNDAQLQLPSERGWKSMRAALHAEPYSVEVTVVAENSKATRRRFTIEAHSNGMVIA